MKSRNIIAVLLTFVLVLTFSDVNVNAMAYGNLIKDNDLYAHAAVLIDGDSGRILFEKNAFEELPVASTTKILSLIVALENESENKIVTISKNAANEPKVKLKVSEGEQYNLSDLYYSMMLESHNDSAVAVAEHIGGSEEGFAELMNKKAEGIGCVNSYFITANGIDKEIEGRKNLSTAYDMALILRYAALISDKKEDFLDICTTKSKVIKSLDNKRSFELYNRNAYMDMDKDMICGKTGYTNTAGYCYAGIVESEGRHFIAVVLASGWPGNKSHRWKDMKKLIQFGKDNFNYIDIFDGSKGHPAITINVKNKSKCLSFLPYEKKRLLIADFETVEYREELYKKVDLPIKAGDDMGRMRLYINGLLYYEEPIKAAIDIK